MTPNASPLTPYLAVIGAGYWGKNLVRNFHQLGVLKTICDGAQPISTPCSVRIGITDQTDETTA